ncbi:ribosomal L28 family [Actinidia rufa]|uniref:Large ribosomal subunit protein bL28m n=1 Tax=Actinidia rufa TaxID=165716 RepID=A0A7J0ERM9_9ERIC|nr:ribosomal L28 family [Actinidia rufa]
MKTSACWTPRFYYHRGSPGRIARRVTSPFGFSLAGLLLLLILPWKTSSLLPGVNRPCLCFKVVFAALCASASSLPPLSPSVLGTCGGFPQFSSARVLTRQRMTWLSGSSPNPHSCREVGCPPCYRESPRPDLGYQSYPCRASIAMLRDCWRGRHAVRVILELGGEDPLAASPCLLMTGYFIRNNMKQVFVDFSNVQIRTFGVQIKGDDEEDNEEDRGREELGTGGERIAGEMHTKQQGRHGRAHRGIFAGRHILFGNRVSEDGGNKSRRCWKPNVQEKRLFSYILDRHIRVKVTTHALRCIDKAGGIDEYLLKTPYHKMDTEMGLFWKAKIEKMYEELGEMEVVFFSPEDEAKFEEGFKELKLAERAARRDSRRQMYGGSGKQKQIEEGRAGGEEGDDGSHRDAPEQLVANS